MGHVSYVPAPSVAPGEKSNANLYSLCGAHDGHMGNVPHIHAFPYPFARTSLTLATYAAASF